MTKISAIMIGSSGSDFSENSAHFWFLDKIITVYPTTFNSPHHRDYLGVTPEKDEKCDSQSIAPQHTA